MSGLAVAILALLSGSSSACSRILSNRRGRPVFSARTMDWFFPFNDFLLVNPRGQAMEGGLGVGNRSATWTSRYGSLVASINGWSSTKFSSRTGNLFDFEKDGATDGINEKGLAAHLLYLDATRYSNDSDVDVSAGVTYLRWVRYLLDTCATVDEAVAAMKRVQIADVLVGESSESEGVSFGVHVAVEDASGDSAIFEVINGTLQTYHGRSQNVSVMTNDPPFPEQLDNLGRFRAFGGMEGLPGDVSSADRFVRLSYFMRHIPKTQDAAAMTGYMRSIIASAAVPQGAPDPDAEGEVQGALYPTWWTSVVDFENLTYHWGWTLNSNIFWVDLRKLAADGKLDEGARTLVLNPRLESLVGEVSGNFHLNEPSQPPGSWSWRRWQLLAGAACPLLCALALCARRGACCFYRYDLFWSPSPPDHYLPF